MDPLAIHAKLECHKERGTLSLWEVADKLKVPHGHQAAYFSKGPTAEILRNALGQVKPPKTSSLSSSTSTKEKHHYT